MAATNRLDPRPVILCAVMSMVLMLACSDRDPTGPAPRGPSLDVQSNGGCLPEVITTYQGSTETLVFTLNPTTPPPPPLQDCDGYLIDGSSFGVDFGDPARMVPPGNSHFRYHLAPSFNVTNPPSPNYVAVSTVPPYRVFLGFDPPVDTAT